jgi:hypothetical protein
VRINPGRGFVKIAPARHPDMAAPELGPAGLGGRMIGGAATGAAIGGAQGAAGSPDWSDPEQVARNALASGLTGARLVAVFPQQVRPSRGLSVLLAARFHRSNLPMRHRTHIAILVRLPVVGMKGTQGR